MAAEFSFTTTPILDGHAMRIYSTSRNWNEYSSVGASAVLTITAADGDAVFGGDAAFTKPIEGSSFNGNFQIDITALELFGSDIIIPDDIYNISILISGGTVYSYDSDEVFYYNAWLHKSMTAYNAVNFICDMQNYELKYACAINVLYDGLIADIAIGNTSGIYDKLDLFKRLYS